MALQQEILEAITAENFERKEKNVFALDTDSKYEVFDEIQINIKGHKWESYIDCYIEVSYNTDHCEGDKTTPPSSHFEPDDVTVYLVTIEVDGLTVKHTDHFKKLVKEAIKKQLIFEIE